MKFILHTNDPRRDEAMMLNKELKVRDTHQDFAQLGILIYLTKRIYFLKLI